MNSSVSIIIPVYNSDKYLKRCLDSIVSQSLKDIEIICIDDYSNDKSVEILEFFAKSDKRIKLFRNERNRGVSYCRNFGISIANSNYIGFVDSDDSIDINMYKIMYELAKKDNSCMLICNFRVIDEFNVKDFKTFFKSQTKDILFKKTLSKDLVPFPVNRIYKKELFVKNKIKYLENRVYEDAEITHKLIYYADKISICEDVFYNYYINPNSITTSFSNKKIDDIFYVLKSTKEFLIHENILQTYNKEYLTMTRICINNILCNLLKEKIAIEDKLKNLEYLWNKIINYKDKNFIHLSIFMNWLHKSCLILKDNKKYLDTFVKKINFDKKIIQNIKELVYSELYLSYSIILKLKGKRLSGVYLYGAGETAKKLIPEIEKLNLQIFGIIDSNTEKDCDLFGYNVSKFENTDFKSNIIIVASESSAYEITEFLEHQEKNFEIINFYS